MSIFEIGMLVCFGSAWPFSIYRSYTSRKNNGKSVTFLFILLLGYIFGILHKIFYNFDLVIYLYILNSIMVSIDILLFYRNARLNKEI
ncbi:MAG: hypothetical protein PHT16_00935 [Candidatus Pacebacteria bacterium]|nr:hypothetical protein [Candidatus Paceibacterota bacterium]